LKQNFKGRLVVKKLRIAERKKRRTIDVFHLTFKRKTNSKKTTIYTVGEESAVWLASGLRLVEALPWGMQQRS